MTILLDDRGGAHARDSAKHYPSILHGLIPNSVLTRLDSGDAAFAGAGDITVGIELKKVADAVNCMFTGRLADTQIPAMRQSYDVCYLIVEGLWRPEPESGVLQWYKGELGKWGKWHDAASGRKRLMYSSFEQWLSTLELQGNIRLRSSPSTDITAALLTSLFNWFQKESHRSYSTLDETTPAAVLSRPTMTRRMIALLPRVGWSRSAVLARKFENMSELTAASPEHFLIENEIGMATAMKMWEALHGRAWDESAR